MKGGPWGYNYRNKERNKDNDFAADVLALQTVSHWMFWPSKMVTCSFVCLLRHFLSFPFPSTKKKKHSPLNQRVGTQVRFGTLALCFIVSFVAPVFRWPSKVGPSKPGPSTQGEVLAIENDFNPTGLSLSQWLNFKPFGITYLVGKIKFKNLISGSIG